MYPVSSNSDIMRNRRRMFGKKIATPPTPLMIPSMRRLLKNPSGMI